MSTINQDKLNFVSKLYEDGLSVREISDRLGVSIDSTYYFFRKNNIKRRNRVEAKNSSFDRQAPSFKVKENLSDSEKELKASGVMLYWGEGSKWEGEKIVDFANSDSDMIIVFLRFLRVICRVDEKKFRGYLYCHTDQDQKELISYWSKITRIPKSQFSKPYVKKEHIKAKRGKMRYGLIHIRYYDKKLLNLIRVWMKEYIEKYK